MNVTAWIAIAAIIIPNAIKAYELYLTHKKEASPKPTENQRMAESQAGEIETKLRRLRKLGVVASVALILFGLTVLAFNLVNASRIQPRSLIVTAIIQTAGVTIGAWTLHSFRKHKH